VDVLIKGEERFITKCIKQYVYIIIYKVMTEHLVNLILDMKDEMERLDLKNR